MSIVISFFEAAFAYPILPLYWVKPARVSKLIGVRQILFWGAGMPLSQSPVRPSRWAEVIREGTSTEVFALGALRQASNPVGDRVPAS
jgi:hypothetical protein